jgi:glutamate dehydrogenase/leucine dehydrogenase
VQGFGNAGRNVARVFREAGARIVGVSDSRGGIYDPDGLSLVEVEIHKDETGSVVDMPATKPLGPKEVLEVPCHVLIPAAMESQITTANAREIQARVVIEAANGPTTPEADDLLSERGISVIPDTLSAAGGVVVSFFEWSQNLANEHWPEAEVNDKLRATMTRAGDTMVTTRAALLDQFDEYERAWRDVNPDGPGLAHPDLRIAAHVVAIQRCRQATEERGIWP